MKVFLVTFIIQFVSINQVTGQISELLSDVSIDESTESIVENSKFDFQYTKDTVYGIIEK